MSSRSVSRNNIIAGGFLITAVALGVATSVIISDSLEYLRPTHRFIVEFTLQQGASGIKPGSAVTLGGQKVGRVTRIAFSGEPVNLIRVEVKVRRGDVLLFQDPTINLERPLLGSTSEINITDVGDQAKGPLERDGVVKGTLGPPAFLAQAGYGPEQRRKVQGVIDEIDRTVTSLSGAIARVEPEVDPIVESIRGSIENIREVTRRARDRSPAWADRIDRTLASAETAAEKFPAISDDVQSGVGEAREVVASMQRVVDENTPGVKNIVTNVESATEKFDRQTVQAINDAAAQTQRALAGLADFLAEASQKLETLWPGVGKILANFRLASDQVRLAAVELRESPWRVFYSPKPRELESENLLVSARTYAQAVSDLRAASEALEAAAVGAPDAHQLATMTRSVRDAFDRYRQAEEALLALLAAERP